MIIFAAKNLENNKREVNDLNVFPVPDGDTGTNMALTIQFAAKEVAKLQNNSLSKIADAASSGSLMGARGNSGVILSQLFRGFAKACKNKNYLNIQDLSFALQSGSDMAYKAVMKPTEGTILTVARESAHYAVENSKDSENISMELFLKKVIQHSKEILEQTPNMLPVLKEAGVVDAGGKGLIYILEGAYKALFEKDILIEDTELLMKADENQKSKGDISTADIKYTYCTELMILTKDSFIDKLKLYLTQIGDSLVVVGDEERIKVHVHTNNPGKVIEYALKIGEITNIKIDNMKEQHKNQLDLSYNDNQYVEENIKEDVEEKEFAFIAVATGEGITKVFMDLGVESVIQGGQTMNPSTEDFLIKIDKLSAKYIYILPNNSNILLAANQAKQISDKNIEVLPTKTIPQGISALLAFNPEKNKNDNFKQMKNAIKEVKSGQITFAIRNTQVNNLEIKKDDIIGLYEGKIVAVGKNINEVTIKLINEMIDENDELITLFAGQDISDEEIEKIQDMLEDKFSNIDIETHYGGQPLYYYIIAVE
jgi:hypothetical protein